MKTLIRKLNTLTKIVETYLLRTLYPFRTNRFLFPLRINKIVGVTPAGRERYLRILVPYLLQNRHVLDEHVFWINTEIKEDIDFIKKTCAEYPNFFKYQESKVPINGNHSIAHFFENCPDKNTMYIRFDDDICFIEKNAISNLVKFRKENQEYFLVFGNIINNAICNFINQKNGALPPEIGKLTYNCMCPEGWENGQVAINIHKHFISDVEKNRVDKYKFDKWVLNDYERVSINFISWFGRDLKLLKAKVGLVVNNYVIEEEPWLTEFFPRKFKIKNCICGDAIVSHLAFYTQRKEIETQTTLLSDFEKLGLVYNNS